MYTKRFHSKRRLHTGAKVAALIAALALVTAMLERPKLTAAPSRARATVEQSLDALDATGGAMERSAPALRASSDEQSSAATSNPMSNHLPRTFPGQFPLPNGEVEPQPTGF